MIRLSTPVDIRPSLHKISYGDRLLLLGSCFADNIGAKFNEYYFQTTVNPYGTLYNPASIANAIADTKSSISDNTLFLYNGMWHSMCHHGSVSHPNKEEVVTRYEKTQLTLRNALRDASTIIITFGTAWVYEMDGRIVANCHKLPADRFVRRCMTVNEIVDIWCPIIASMSDKHWIFTVSPIRHIKDGLHANQISKSILLQAIDTLIASTHSSNRLTYFPSYEIMLDELRDYRFYAEDMVHPSPLAVEYIWQRFVDTFMTESMRTEMRTLHQLWLDRQHRFLHPESLEAKAFAHRLTQRIQEVQTQYPWIH
jgi:hypothetical protein